MRTLAALVAASLVAVASPAMAADFSFTGLFADDNDQVYFDFTASGASTITLRSYSYAGGTNAAGTDIAAGGFDPILSLYDLTTGQLIETVDDGPDVVPADPVTGAFYDTNFSKLIAAGTYRVFVTEYRNFGGPTLADGFPYTSPTATSVYCEDRAVAPFCDATGAQRDGHWAFDLLGVDQAVQGTVPEPATWAMMIAGFGIVGAAMRRRRGTVAYA